MNNGPMRKLAHLVLIMATSALMLAILHVIYFSLPKRWNDQSYLLSDVIIGLLAIQLIRLFCPSRTTMFKLPEFNLKLFVSLAIGAALYWFNFRSFHLHITPARHAVWGVTCLLGIGFAEEVFSRGFVFNLLRKYGIWWAAFISSFFFGLMHIPYFAKEPFSIDNFTQITNAACWGVVVCGVYILTKSIWPGIFIHAFSDTTLFFAAKEVAGTGANSHVSPTLTTVLVDLGAGFYFVLIGSALIYYAKRSEEKQQRTFTNIPEPLKIEL